MREEFQNITPTNETIAAQPSCAPLENIETPATCPPPDTAYIDRFCTMPLPELLLLGEDLGLSLTSDGLLFAQAYFRDTERRIPTVGELRFLDRYARYAALTPESVAIAAPDFESEADKRVWQDICRKRETLTNSPISPQTVWEILSVCGRYLSRGGRTESYPSLTLTDRFTAAAIKAEAPSSDAFLLPTLMPPVSPRTNAKMTIVLLRPREKMYFAEEIASLCARYPQMLHPIRYLDDEGLVTHLRTLSFAITLDLSLFPDCEGQGVFDALRAATRHTMLFWVRESDLPTLMATTPELIPVGSSQENHTLTLRRGVFSLCRFTYEFLDCWHQSRKLFPFIDDVAAGTITAPLLFRENGAVLGTISATGRCMEAIITLIRAMFSAGVHWGPISITATLSLPDGTDKTVCDALPLLLDYHRAVAELALPGERHRLLCRHTLSAPTLTVAIAAPQATAPDTASVERLLAITSEGNFAALREILCENL